MIGRALRLLALLPTRPGEFCDRVGALISTRLDRWRARPAYPEVPWDRVVGELSAQLGADGPAILAEPALRDVEAHLVAGVARLATDAPYPLVACGDASLGRICYLVCRASQPQTVVETGVLYGVTSAFILQALHVNGSGTLHSVDLPPLRRDQERFVGCLIPSERRARWQLHRGSSRRVLPKLLAALPPVDVFVHDSLHTYSNMSYEFSMASEHAAARSILVSDDVHGNAAFLERSSRPDVRFAATVRELTKPGCFGVCITARP